MVMPGTDLFRFSPYKTAQFPIGTGLSQTSLVKLETVDGSPLPPGISVTSLADVGHGFEALAHAAAENSDPVFVMARQSPSAPLVIGVSAGVRVSTPLRLSFRESDDRLPEGTLAQSAEVHLILGEGASVTVLEDWNVSRLICEHTVVILNQVLAPGATLDLGRMVHGRPRDGSARFFVRAKLGLRAQSTARTSTLLMGGDATQIRAVTELHEEAASITASHLIVGERHQHLDLAAEVHHHGRKTQSDLRANYFLSDESVGVFNGTVWIHPKAAGSKAYQKSRCLLASDKAKMHALPKLEILTDDVQCAHGASVSPLETEHLFYLESRGFSRPEAEHWLRLGFVRSALELVTSPTLKAEWITCLESERGFVFGDAMGAPGGDDA